MIALGSLSNSSGLAVITSALQNSASNASSSTNIPNSGDSSASSGATLSVSISGAGVVEAIVNHQINQSERTEQTASEVQQMIDTMKQNNSLTSQQVSSALYTGSGLTRVGTSDSDGIYDTIQSGVAQNESVANYESSFASTLTQWLSAGRPSGTFGTGSDSLSASFVQSLNQNDSDADVQNMITKSNNYSTQEHQQDTEITQALNAGNLTIQKATDISDLDYTESDSWNVSGGVMSGSGSQHWNSSALDVSSDGTEHTLMNLGGVELYLSWNQQGQAQTSSD